MRRITKPIYLTVLCVAVCGSPASAIDVRNDAGHRLQELEAWGTSLAWFGNGLGLNDDEATKSLLMDMLFDPANGLGMNYVRYNIGGGQNPANGHLRVGGDVPGWVPIEPSDPHDRSTWAWDWDADVGQRWTIHAAIDRGANLAEAFSNSAPYWMTLSGDVRGNTGGAENIDQTFYSEFGHYLAKVTDHFENNEGIRFRTLEPLNEPDANWWNMPANPASTGGQEGMTVNKANQDALLREVFAEMNAVGVSAKLAAMDEAGHSWARDSYNTYDQDVRDAIAQLNAHGYCCHNTNQSTSLRNLAASEGKRLYMNEWGTGNSSALNGGLTLANRITHDLKHLQPAAWTYWQAIEHRWNNGGWGLIHANFNNPSNNVVRPQYHVMRQYTAYIRPGSTVLDVNDADTIAAHDPAADTTVIVVNNDQATPHTPTYDVSNLPQAPTFTRVITTDATNSFVSLGPASVVNGQISPTLAGESVTTIVMHHRPNLVNNGNFFNQGSVPFSPAPGGGVWRFTGKASYAGPQDNTHDGSHAVELRTDLQFSAGKVYQDGIGDGVGELTGEAFEFSVDVWFPTLDGYDASTYIGLEFLGPDGSTLAHGGDFDYLKRIEPVLDAESNWRVYKSDTVAAPPGAYYVRPVIRFISSGQGVGVVYADNAYLGAVDDQPRGRAWVADAGGAWDDDANWLFDVDTARHTTYVFGDAISAPRTIVSSTPQTAKTLHFDSTHAYSLLSLDVLLLDGGGDVAEINARRGSHQLNTSVKLLTDARFVVAQGAALHANQSIDLDGHTLAIHGRGDVHLGNDLFFNGGTLELNDSATVHLSANLPGDSAIAVDVLDLGHTPMVSTDITLDGALTINQLTALTLGDEKNLVSATGATGIGGAFVQPAIVGTDLPDPGHALALLYEDTDANSTIDRVRLLVTYRGDANGDGAVTLIDLNNLGANFGQAGTWQSGDFNYDGVVSLLDLNALGANFGQTIAHPAAVPEPAGLALLALGGLAFTRRRRAKA